MTKFQSSPALKDRCNVYRDYRVRGGYEFQSSPALKDRCNAVEGRIIPVSELVSILTGLERPVQLSRPAGTSTVRWFQSSPALKDRCNLPATADAFPPRMVSILTGLERPVQASRRGQKNCPRIYFNPHRP